MSLIGGKAAHPAAAAWAQERMYLQEQCKEIARAEENSSENNASGQSMDEANEDNIPNETPEDWLQLWAQQSKQIQDLMVKYKEELETLKARHQLEKNQFLRKYLDNALPKTSRCLEKHLVDRLDPVQAPGGSPLRKAQPITTNDNPPIESRNPTAPAPTVEDGGGVPDKPVQGISTISTTLTEAQSPPGSREVLYGFIQRRHIDGKVRLMFCVRGRMAQAKRQAAELCHTTKRPRLGDKQTDNNVIPDRITQSILTTGAERPMPQLPQGLNTQASSQSQPGLTLQPEGPTHERSLTYAQVRDNAIKHGHWDTIIEHPQDSKKWYVLFCEEHGVHFKPMALGGAAKHLHSKYHTGFDNRNRDNALKHLGYRIIDCTTALQASHNAQVEQAYMNGYKPADIKSFRSSRNKSSPTKSLQVNSTRNSLLIITHPQQFYLYYGEYKEKGVVRYWPVLILGWDDQRPGGLKGRLASLDTSGLLRDEAELPECYVYSNDKKRITGWAPGYEDNGSYVQMREFPVVFFDETMSTGWIPASELSELDLHRPETGPAYPAWALHDARRFIANREGFPSWEKREEKKTKGRPNMSARRSTPGKINGQDPVPSVPPVNHLSDGNDKPHSEPRGSTLPGTTGFSDAHLIHSNNSISHITGPNANAPPKSPNSTEEIHDQNVSRTTSKSPLNSTERPSTTESEGVVGAVGATEAVQCLPAQLVTNQPLHISAIRECPIPGKESQQRISHIIPRTPSTTPPVLNAITAQVRGNVRIQSSPLDRSRSTSDEQYSPKLAELPKMETETLSENSYTFEPSIDLAVLAERDNCELDPFKRDYFEVLKYDDDQISWAQNSDYDSLLFFKTDGDKLLRTEGPMSIVFDPLRCTELRLKTLSGLPRRSLVTATMIDGNVVRMILDRRPNKEKKKRLQVTMLFPWVRKQNPLVQTDYDADA